MYSSYQQPKCTTQSNPHRGPHRRKNTGTEQGNRSQKPSQQYSKGEKQSTPETCSPAASCGTTKTDRRTGQKSQQPNFPAPLSFLQQLLPHGSTGDLMALLILLLLLAEGKEDSSGTILTLLIFLFL